MFSVAGKAYVLPGLWCGLLFCGVRGPVHTKERKHGFLKNSLPLCVQEPWCYFVCVCGPEDALSFGNVSPAEQDEPVFDVVSELVPEDARAVAEA